MRTTVAWLAVARAAMAHTVSAASGAGAAGADTLLLLAPLAFPARVARALAVHTRAVLAAATGARAVLAPLAMPSGVAHARATQPIARPMPVAAVHAAAHRPARRRRRRVPRRRAAVRRLALARPIDAPAAPRTRRFASRAGRARAVLAVGAAPAGVAHALAARRVAYAVVVAPARCEARSRGHARR